MQVCHFWAFQPQPASQVWEGVNRERVRRREEYCSEHLINGKVGRYGIICNTNKQVQYSGRAKIESMGEERLRRDYGVR